MVLDRLAIAGIAGAVRTALSLLGGQRRVAKPSATTRPELVETQMVVAPDQQLLKSLDIDIDQRMGGFQ